MHLLCIYVEFAHWTTAVHIRYLRVTLAQHLRYPLSGSKVVDAEIGHLRSKRFAPNRLEGGLISPVIGHSERGMPQGSLKTGQ